MGTKHLRERIHNGKCRMEKVLAQSSLRETQIKVTRGPRCAFTGMARTNNSVLTIPSSDWQAEKFKSNVSVMRW